MSIFEQTKMRFAKLYCAFIFHCLVLIAFEITASNASNCVDIDRVDAITKLVNDSLFVASQDRFWLLAEGEKPAKYNARKISEIAPEMRNIVAAANIQLKTDKNTHQCYFTGEQLVLYGNDVNGSHLLKVYANNKWTDYNNLADFEPFSVLNDSKTNSSEIDGLTFFDNLVVIFHGKSYSTLRCDAGKWLSVKRTDIKSSYATIDGSIDAAVVNPLQRLRSPVDDLFLYLFKGHSYYVCPIYGTEPCTGPFSLTFDFFKADSHCSDFSLQLALLKYTVTAALIVLLIIFLISLGYLLATRSRQITFWVNRYTTRQTQEHQLRGSYEALKMQKENDIGSNGNAELATNGNADNSNNVNGTESAVPFITTKETKETTVIT